jgi:hypothetical protein
MKLLYLPLFLIFLFPCNPGTERDENLHFSHLSFSIDTVMVDPGDDIINLNGHLYVSAIHPSGTYLYNWDQTNFMLEKINLDKLILEDKIPFQKEGPNGVGSFVGWISMTDDDQIVISNYQDMSLFNLDGEKIKALNLRKKNFEGDKLEDHENFNWKSILANKGNQLYGIIGNYSGKNLQLGKVDFDSNTFSKYLLPEYDKLSDYMIRLNSPNRSEIIAPPQFVNQYENKIIFSTSVFNTLMIYDISLDSLYRMKYANTLTKNSKTGKYRNEVETKEEFREISSKISKEVSFYEPLWDISTQKFYRFSNESLPTTTLADGTPKFNNKIYLTIFDKDFNLLGENLVKELNIPPFIHFVKDGKIWIFRNIDDELAFIRLSIL